MHDTGQPTLGHGKICYIQVPSGNIHDSAYFYQQVFGWKIRIRKDGSIAFDDGVNQVSGTWVLNQEPSANPTMLIYIMVHDVGATMEVIKAQGGTIVQEIGADAPEITARFADPYGNVWGLFQER